jgi:hypothetical protein
VDITIQLDSHVSVDELTTIGNNLGVNQAALPEYLRRVGIAAIVEYLDMITGRTVDSLSSDSAERRLERFIKYYYRQRIPTEAEITKTFHVPQARAKTLLGNLAAKRRHEINNAIDATIKDVLGSCVKSGPTKAELTIGSSFLVDEIKNLLEQHASGMTSITKRRGSVDTYEIGIDTYNQLAPLYHLQLLPLDL